MPSLSNLVRGLWKPLRKAGPVHLFVVPCTKQKETPMTTEPTEKHKEEARAIRLPFPCGCVDAHEFGDMKVDEYTCATHRAIASALASRDSEVREVLEGLASKHYVSLGEYCWCRAPGTATKPAGDYHGDACLAARGLWERVNLTEPSD